MRTTTAWLLAILLNLVIGVSAARAHCCDPCGCRSPAPAPAESPVIRDFTVYFDTGSYQLDDRASAKVKDAATVLRRLAPDDQLVIVHGHTDTIGTAHDNRVLGLSRAMAVSDRLVELGVSSGRISMESFGESKPVSPYHSRNRRVEIKLTQQ